MPVSIAKLNFGYGRKAIFADSSLDIERPISRLTVVGPSGCGKTTFLHLLAGHLRPTSGSIIVCGTEVIRPEPARPLVFQDQNLLPWQSVVENAAFGLKCRGDSKRSRIAEATRRLTDLGLDGCLNWTIDKLSGGMKQRVGIARALALQPQCLLMDEPFSALDQLAKESLLKQLALVTSVSNTKIILVTHDLLDAAQFGQNTLVIDSSGNFEVLDWHSKDSTRIEECPQELGRRVAELRKRLVATTNDRGVEQELSFS